MDKSHFFWLLTYFLKFARQLEIGMDHHGQVPLLLAPHLLPQVCQTTGDWNGPPWTSPTSSGSSPTSSSLPDNWRLEWTTMDKSHFFWLLTYFLKFARQLEIGMDLIGGVLSIDTLSYITFEGVEQIETMDLANRER